MPSTSTKTKEDKIQFQPASSGLRSGEPSGEPPATLSGHGQRLGSGERLVEAMLGRGRSGLCEELVDAAVEQRRLRAAIGQLDRSCG
jgi:hypothetical protein